MVGIKGDIIFEIFVYEMYFGVVVKVCCVYCDGFDYSVKWIYVCVIRVNSGVFGC